MLQSITTTAAALTAATLALPALVRSDWASEYEASKTAANPPGVSAAEDEWRHGIITCQGAQNIWQVCTNEDLPMHLGVMLACPVTCAVARGEEVEAALEPITNLDCATAVHQKQETEHPGWRTYDQRHGGDIMAASAVKQPLGAGWEPILEEQPGCTGLAAGQLMEYSWLVVLDASWVAYYAEQKEHFATQGYHTLETSANLMFDRVSYLFEAQFGIRLRVSRVYSFADLREACETNSNNPDDGTPQTSTRQALERAGVVTTAAEAGILRMGAGSQTPGVWCASTSPIHGLCSGTGYHGLTSMEPPFGKAEEGDGGKLNFKAMATMAHELGHFFGLCGGGVLTAAQCLSGHLVNEIPDLMMAGCVDGQCGSIYGPLPRQFLKFLPSCTPLYERLLCRNVQRQTCGVAVQVGSAPAPAVHVAVPTKPTVAPASTTPAPAADAPLQGYELQEHLRDSFCNGAPAASNKVGQFPVYEWASRQACANACSADAECTFFLWKECAPGECATRYHCARWHTDTACDSAHGYGDGDSALIFKKESAAASTPAHEATPTVVPDQTTAAATVGVATTTPRGSTTPLRGYVQQQHLNDSYCHGSQAASNTGGATPQGEYASQQACADACTAAADCTFFLWKDCVASGESCGWNYHCARWHTDTACDSAHSYGDGDSAIIFKKVATDGGDGTACAVCPVATRGRRRTTAG